MPRREVILNGGFESNTTTGAGNASTDNWTGNDFEINPLSAFFSGGDPSDRVVELDGNAGQISTAEQTFTLVDTEGGGILSFDMGIRNRSAGDVGVDGAEVEILDDQGGVIFSVTVLPTAFGEFERFSFEVDFPGPGDYTLRFTEVGDNESLGAVLNDVSLLVCFCTGAGIETPDGPVAIENLKEGDLVLTMDHGPQPVRWIGKRRVEGAEIAADPELRPVLIRAGAMGPGAPDRDVRVSPQHRVLISDRAARLTFGEDEILAPAKALRDGVRILTDARERATDYFHILFDRHEVIWANGLPTESFHPAEGALTGVDAVARNEILTLFPDLATDAWPPARPTLTVREASVLAGAHPFTEVFDGAEDRVTPMMGHGNSPRQT